MHDNNNFEKQNNKSKQNRLNKTNPSASYDTLASVVDELGRQHQDRAALLEATLRNIDIDKMSDDDNPETKKLDRLLGVDKKYKRN
jgi:hypothetical protein